MKRFFVRFLAGILFVSVPIAGVMIYAQAVMQCGK